MNCHNLSLNRPLGYLIFVYCALCCGFLRIAKILLTEEPAVRRFGEPESGLIELHPPNTERTGSVHRKTQRGHVERTLVQAQRHNPWALERTRIHIDFKRCPFSGEVRIAQIPVVEDIRVEFEYRPSPTPAVDKV